MKSNNYIQGTCAVHTKRKSTQNRGLVMWKERLAVVHVLLYTVWGCEQEKDKYARRRIDKEKERDRDILVCLQIRVCDRKGRV